MHRRIDDPKPAPAQDMPATMKQLRDMLEANFALVQSLDMRSVGRMLEDFDKRMSAVGRKP